MVNTNLHSQEERGLVTKSLGLDFCFFKRNIHLRSGVHSFSFRRVSDLRNIADPSKKKRKNQSHKTFASALALAFAAASAAFCFLDFFFFLTFFLFAFISFTAVCVLTCRVDICGDVVVCRKCGEENEDEI